MSTITRRRRPPYSANLCAILATPQLWPTLLGASADGRTLSLYIACGSDAWELGREWRDHVLARPFLVAPPGEDPASFDWSVAARIAPPVVLRPAGTWSPSEEAALAAALLRDGVQRVLGKGLVRYLPKR